MKVSSLKINGLPLLKINGLPLLFQLQKRFAKWRQPCQRFVKNDFRKLVFCEKAQYFVHFGLNDFVQILPAGVQNTYQIMYGETLDFQCQNLQR